MPENDNSVDLKKFIRIAAFILFMLPLTSQALQIEFASSTMIPIHWLFVIQAGIGAGLASMAGIIKDVFQKHDDELNSAIVDLAHTIETNGKDRDITERDIIINSYVFNDKWLAENKTILTSKDLLAKLKSTEEELPEKF